MIQAITNPNAMCREYGIKDLNELAELAEANVRTLYNWAKNKPKLFELVIIGAAEDKRQNCRDSEAVNAFK